MGSPVRVNELGLAITPSRLECVGESCPRYLENNSCFVDAHHLYFPRARYFALGWPYDRFANDSFNRIWMPRCRHDEYHRRKAWTPLPPEEVVVEFLAEAEVLHQLGMVWGALKEIEDALFTDNARKMARDQDRYLEVYQMFLERVPELEAKVNSFEVLPSTGVDMSVGQYAGSLLLAS